MIRLIISIFLIGIFNIAAEAQITFSKVEGLQGASEFGTTVVKTSKGFLATYGDKDQSLKTYCLGTMALDSEGFVLKKNSICYGENAIVRYGRSLLLRNNNIAYYGTLQQYDTIKKDFTTWTALTLFNDLGDTLWTKQFLDSNKHVSACTLIETPDSGLFLVGDETFTASNHNPLIIRVDKNGNEISKHTNLHSGNTAIYSIVKHPNGKYYGGGYSGNGIDADAFVTEMDSNLNPIWSKSYKSGIGNGANLTVLNDQNIVFGTDTLLSKHSSTLYTNRKQLFKIDTSGIVIWKKIHDEIGEDNYYRKIIETKKGDLIAIGRRKPQEGIHYTLTKLTAEGDTIWMHKYAYEDIEGINYLWDMVATEDGGVMMVGDVTPDGSRFQDVWLVKVDSNGCINNDCAKTLVYGDLVSVLEKEKESILLTTFPNPNKGSFTVSGLKNFTNSNGYIEILVFDIMGKEVFKEKRKGADEINVKLPRGISGSLQLILSNEKGQQYTHKIIVNE